MLRIAVAYTLAVVASTGALAHSSSPDKEAHAPGNSEHVETPFGVTGKPGPDVKAVTVEMNDDMEFKPSVLHIRPGDTVRFVVKNEGEVLHEMVLGRVEDLAEHKKQMENMPDMKHGQPYMTHVKAGETGEILWKFTKPGTFEYACLLPGHYESGMKGTIYVQVTGEAGGLNLAARHLEQAPGSTR